MEGPNKNSITPKDTQETQSLKKQSLASKDKLTNQKNIAKRGEENFFFNDSSNVIYIKNSYKKISILNFKFLNSKKRQDALNALSSLRKFCSEDSKEQKCSSDIALNVKDFLNEVNKLGAFKSKSLKIFKNAMTSVFNVDSTVSIGKNTSYIGKFKDDKPNGEAKIIFETTGRELKIVCKDGKIQSVEGKTSEGYDINSKLNSNGKLTSTQGLRIKNNCVFKT